MTPGVLQQRTTAQMGWRPDIPDFRDYSYGEKLGEEAQEVPEGRLETRLLRGLPVIDQGNLGSCTGCSVAVLHAAVRRVVLRSALQIYYEARRIIGETERDEGAYIRDAIKVIANLGAGRASWWPYDPRNVYVDPPLKVDRDALLRRIFSYYRLGAGGDYRACLAAGYPFVIGIALFSRFMMGLVEETGVVPFPTSSERFQGGHAVCVWGYEPNFRDTKWAGEAGKAGMTDVPERAYLVRNSWGEGWGRDGNFAIDADYLENSYLADDAWTIRKVAQPTTA